MALILFLLFLILPYKRCNYIIAFIRNENKLFISYQEKVTRGQTGGAPGSNKVNGRIYWELSYHQTGSSSEGSGNYDNWIEIDTGIDGSNVGNPSLSSVSSADTWSLAANGEESIVIDIPVAYQTKELKLTITPLFSILGSGTDTIVTAYTKNVVVTTGRGLATTWDSILDAPVFPFPLGPV